MGGWRVREGVWDAGVNRGEKVIGIRQWGAGGWYGWGWEVGGGRGHRAEKVSDSANRVKMMCGSLF